jgi:hypothetical protein
MGWFALDLQLESNGIAKQLYLRSIIGLLTGNVPLTCGYAHPLVGARPPLAGPSVYRQGTSRYVHAQECAACGQWYGLRDPGEPHARVPA